MGSFLSKLLSLGGDGGGGGNDDGDSCHAEQEDLESLLVFHRGSDDSERSRSFRDESALGLPDYDIDSAMLEEGAGVIDTHCHMDFIMAKLGYNRPRSLEEFRLRYQHTFPKCFLGFVSVFCKPDTWLQYGIENMLEASPQGVRVTYGCHPHFAEQLDHGKLLLLKELLKRPNVAAVGEIGLDYSPKNTCPRETQIRVFKLQLNIAMRKMLPVCLHIRDAITDGFNVLQEVGVPRGYPLHIHCFTGGWGECQRWLTEYPGCYIGLTPLVANHMARHVHEVATKIPLERLILETDSPYFLPQKVKESDYELKMSLPGHIIHAAAQIAALRDLPLSVVLKATTNNAQALYRLDFMIPNEEDEKKENQAEDSRDGEGGEEPGEEDDDGKSREEEMAQSKQHWEAFFSKQLVGYSSSSTEEN